MIRVSPEGVLSRSRLGIQKHSIVQPQRLPELKFGNQGSRKPELASTPFYRRMIYLITSAAFLGIGTNALITRNFSDFKKNQEALMATQVSQKAQATPKPAESNPEFNLLAQKPDPSIAQEQVPQVVRKVTPSTAMIQGATDNRGATIGSAVIIEDINRERYLLTNSHVVERGPYKFKKGEKVFLISLYNGSDYQKPFQFEAPILKLPNDQYAASLMEEHDLALLHIPKELELPAGVRAAEIRNARKEPIQVGERVVAVGCPYGLRDSVTHGIISNNDRALPEEPKNPFLQTDAAINPGNSGGGLFDRHGRLIGINTIKRPGDGIGGAIRVDAIEEVLKGWGIYLLPE